jgi:hypothetical protein
MARTVEQAVAEVIGWQLPPMSMAALLLDLMDQWSADDILAALPERDREPMATAWRDQLGDATDLIRFADSATTDAALNEYRRWAKGRR